MQLRHSIRFPLYPSPPSPSPYPLPPPPYLVGHTQTTAIYGGLCGMPACGQAVGCGMCLCLRHAGALAWRRGPVCACMRVCWARRNFTNTDIHALPFRSPINQSIKGPHKAAHGQKGEATSQHHHRGQQTLHHEVMQALGAVNDSRQR